MTAEFPADLTSEGSGRLLINPFKRIRSIGELHVPKGRYKCDPCWIEGAQRVEVQKKTRFVHEMYSYIDIRVND